MLTEHNRTARQSIIVWRMPERIFEQFVITARNASPRSTLVSLSVTRDGKLQHVLLVRNLSAATTLRREPFADARFSQIRDTAFLGLRTRLLPECLQLEVHEVRERFAGGVGVLGCVDEAGENLSDAVCPGGGTDDTGIGLCLRCTHKKR